MSSDNRGNYHSQPPPIYTVSGMHPDNLNYGFHSTPPPKYEEAVRGTPMEQPLPIQGGLQPAQGVLLVSPAYTEQKRRSNVISALLLLLFFLIFFIYISIRMRL